MNTIRWVFVAALFWLALAVACCHPVRAQNAITLPLAANAVAYFIHSDI